MMKTGQWRGRAGLAVALAAIAAFFVVRSSPGIIPRPVTHVIHISMDGLRSDAITSLGPAEVPNFYRLRTEGAFTDNARTDYDYTITLPNHVSQLTGRPVLGDTGHHWTGNTDPAEGETLASNQGAYIAGVFDVVHDFGLPTGLFASKTKFSLFDVSWDATHGAPDFVGPDDGNGKIDVFVVNEDTAVLASALVSNMIAEPFGYVFIHFRDPDSAGHSYGWDMTPGSAYSEVIKVMDRRLGQFFDMIETNAQLAGHTAIILTSDHGGIDFGHGVPTRPEEYTIPFYVWGPGVMGGADLYALNPQSRLDPGTNRPSYSDPVPPVRNGDAANTALQLLLLQPVPGSTLNSAENLRLGLPSPSDFRMSASPTRHMLHFTPAASVRYDIQSCEDLRAGEWITEQTNILGTGTLTNIDLGPRTSASRFYRLKLHL